MTIILVVSWLIIGLLGAYIVFIHQEIRKIAQQLIKISQRPTNAELQLTAKNRSMTNLVNELNKFLRQNKTMYQTLQKSSEQFDQAINNITHDLRTPLTVASGYNQYLQQHLDLSDHEKAALGLKIADNLADVESKLESLLAYNRISEGNLQVELTKLNLTQLLEQQMLTYFESFKEKEIEVALSIEPEVMLVTDSALMKRIIQNALGNILVHGERQAEVRLSVNDDMITLKFSNQTSQMITDYQRLFERFYTEDLARKEKNAGLGLYIIKELTETLGGTVILDGSQCCFDLTISFKMTSQH